MTPELLAARFSTDEDLIKHGLECIVRGTKDATGGQLKLLNQAGLLPTGIYQYLLAIKG